MTLQFRKTLKNRGFIEGVGLHSGEIMKIIFHPAPSGTGLLFYRKTGVSSSSILPVDLEYVIDTSMAVTLGNGYFHTQTVEHLMFALHVLGITDLIMEVQGASEIPIVDGSAEPYMQLFDELEYHTYAEQVLPVVISEPIFVADGDRYLLALPHMEKKISYSIDYPHPELRNMHIQVNYHQDFFKKKVGRARTFGFLKEVEFLKKQGLAQGGSTVNVLVFTQDGTVNEPRFYQEPLFHKLLDLIGDLALIGRPIQGQILGAKAGHALDVAFGKKILRAEGKTKFDDQYRQRKIEDLNQLYKISSYVA